jgi:hypothetical protein
MKGAVIMNTMSKWWASTVMSLSALGAAILSSAPAKANCGVVDSHLIATSANTWYQSVDYCANGTVAALNYQVAFANGSSFGYAINNTTSFNVSGGSHSFNDRACVWCANTYNPVCGSWAGLQTQTGNLPATFPPSSFATCPTGDSAFQGRADVIVY